VWRDSEALAGYGFRRLESSFSQGAKWKELISKHITVIALSGDAFCAEQNMPCELPRTPVSNAMIAKVGAAARHSQSAGPRAAAWSLPAEPPAVSCLVESSRGAGTTYWFVAMR
jgi:hypothetical protein